MKKTNILVVSLGHLILINLHYYFLLNRGGDVFQLFSFSALHHMWHHFYNDYLKERIYGLK